MSTAKITTITPSARKQASARRFRFVCSWCGRSLREPSAVQTPAGGFDNYGICTSCLQQCLERIHGDDHDVDGVRRRGVVSHLRTVAPMRRHA